VPTASPRDPGNRRDRPGTSTISRRTGKAQPGGAGITTVVDVPDVGATVVDDALVLDGGLVVDDGDCRGVDVDLDVVVERGAVVLAGAVGRTWVVGVVGRVDVGTSTGTTSWVVGAAAGRTST
jgi:hypothetical protein